MLKYLMSLFVQRLRYCRNLNTFRIQQVKKEMFADGLLTKICGCVLVTNRKMEGFILLFGQIFMKIVNTNIIDYNKERSEEHTSELQSRPHLVCRLLLEKKKKKKIKKE